MAGQYRLAIGDGDSTESPPNNQTSNSMGFSSTSALPARIYALALRALARAARPLLLMMWHFRNSGSLPAISLASHMCARILSAHGFRTLSIRSFRVRYR